MALLDDGSDDSATQYGNLFGGAGNSMLAPFVGQQGMEAARDNSLMSMGAAMMQASGKSFDPSHSSFMSSLGGGLMAGQNAYQGGMQRGIQNAGAALNLAKNRWLINTLQGATGGQAPGAAAPQGVPTPTSGLPGSTPMVSGAGTGGGTAPPTLEQPAGNGAGGPGTEAPATQGASPQDALTPGGSMNPLGVPRGTAALGLALDPQGYMNAQMGMYAPTDLAKTAMAAGLKPGTPAWDAAMSASVARQTAPQATRLPNGYLLNGQYQGVPNAEGIVSIPDPTAPGGYRQVNAGGSTGAIANAATAQASGKANFTFQPRFDPTTGQPISVPSTQAASAAGIPVPGMNMPGRSGAPSGPLSPVAAINQLESGGASPTAAISNPASSAQGSMQVLARTRDLPGLGVKPSNGTPQDTAREGADYYNALAQRYQDPNLGALAYAWGLGNVDTWLANGAKPGDVPPDKMQYVQRFVALTGGGGAQTPQGAAAPAGVQPNRYAPNGSNPNATGPALGLPQREQEAQSAASDSMTKDYTTQQQFMQSAPQQLQALQKMRALAANKTIFSTGPLGDTEIAQDNPLNPAPAEFEKQRSNYLTVAGSTGTDAQRAQAAHSVPDYGKPKQAILDGLDTQIQQTQQRMLRAQYLTPAYNAGDASAYTTNANAFDQHVLPAMVPAMQMPPGPARAAALQGLIAKDPSMRTNLNWALQNGLIQTGGQ